jgi:hypothetical protein
MQASVKWIIGLFDRVCCTFLLCCFFSAGSVNAQDLEASFSRAAIQLGLTANDTAYPDLFVFYDKNLYSISDEIWFSAYLLNASDLKNHHTLTVVLVNDMSNTMVCSNRFVFDQGLGTGSFPIPDSLQTGEYSLIAYSNKLSEGSHEKFFRQSISILGPEKLPYIFKFLEPVEDLSGNDSMTVRCKILDTDGGSGTNATISYVLYADAKPLISGRLLTDHFGEISFSMPVSFIAKTIEISGQITKGSKKMHFKIPVQWESKNAVIKFQPEGGKLISGCLSRIGVEIRNTSGKTVSTKGSVLENGRAIADFETDIYGHGFFDMSPIAGNKYSVQLHDVDPGNLFQEFPTVHASGYNISARSGIVTDTLDLTITGPSPGSRCMLVIHNGSQILYGILVALPNKKGNIRISCAGMTKGIATVSLFDEAVILQQQRTIMILDNEQLVTKIYTDSSTYGTRSKVKIQIAVSDLNGKPVKSVISFSTALAKAIENSRPGINRFQYADRLLPAPFSVSTMAYASRASQLESALLMQQYGYGDSLEFSPIRMLSKSSFDGEVKYNNKKLKKPATILVTGGNTLLLTTDSIGRFKFPIEALRGPAQSKVLVSVTAKSPSGYTLIIDSSERRLQTALAAKYYPLNRLLKDELTAAEKEQIRSAQGENLDAVVVTARPNDRGNFFGKIESNGYCNDYVCRLNFLNCQTHGKGSEGTKIPVDGETYNVEGVMGTGTVVYHCRYKGLLPHMRSVNAIYYPAEFYVPDPLLENSPQLLNRTTLHWAPFIETDENGKAEISFYTNDVEGRFSCEVQGISVAGVLSGSAEFNVSKTK